MIRSDVLHPSFNPRCRGCGKKPTDEIKSNLKLHNQFQQQSRIFRGSLNPTADRLARSTERANRQIRLESKMQKKDANPLFPQSARRALGLAGWTLEASQ